MPRIIVNDIRKTSKKEKLILKEEREKGYTSSPARQNALNLNSLDQQKRCFTRKVSDGESLRKQLQIDDISGNKKQEKVYYLHIDSIQTPKSRSQREILRLVSMSLLILLAINMMSIYQQGVKLKSSLITSAAAGYGEIMQGAKEASQLDFQKAESTFSEGQNKFQEALRSVEFLKSKNYLPLAKEATTESVEGILQAGKSISSAGNAFAQGISGLEQFPQLFIQANLASTVKENTQLPSLTEKLKIDLHYLEQAVSELKIAKASLEKVQANGIFKNVAPDFAQKLEAAKNQINSLLELSEKAQEKVPALLKLLGDRYPHRILFLLQNDAEARPTGGFIGSLLMVVLNDGYITKFEFRDVYELDGQLKEKIDAPEEIAKITKNWRLRDSNYSPDFTISAEKAAWFLQKEKGDSVDSVIAINQSLIGEFLKELGEIAVPSLKAPLNEKNYQLVLSYLIEAKVFGKEEPKKILEELLPLFKDRLLMQGSFSKIFKVILDGIEQKNLLFYSRDESVQKLFDDFKATGRQKSVGENEDFLQVTATSIGGNKSDAFIIQTLEHNTFINNDGTVTDELTIKRRHNWTEQSLFEWRKELKKFGYEQMSDLVIDILGRGMNKAAIKVYVPQGAVLQNVIGTDRNNVVAKEDPELKKTYFSFEMAIYPGNEQDVTLRYELPKKLKFHPADTYKLVLQRQPGMVISHIQKQIIPSVGLGILREYPTEQLVKEGEKLQFEFELEKDTYVSALLSN